MDFFPFQNNPKNPDLNSNLNLLLPRKTSDFAENGCFFFSILFSLRKQYVGILVQKIIMSKVNKCLISDIILPISMFLWS